MNKRDQTDDDDDRNKPLVKGQSDASIRTILLAISVLAAHRKESDEHHVPFFIDFLYT